MMARGEGGVGVVDRARALAAGRRAGLHALAGVGPGVRRNKKAWRRGMAHHEAAHAVTAAALGWTVDLVMLAERMAKGARSGVVYGRPLPDATAAGYIIQQTAVSLAGQEAFLRATQDPGWAHYSGVHDRETVANLFAEMGIAKTDAADRAMRVAATVISVVLSTYWSEVRECARRLLNAADESIPGSDVVDLVRAVPVSDAFREALAALVA